MGERSSDTERSAKEQASGGRTLAASGPNSDASDVGHATRTGTVRERTAPAPIPQLPPPQTYAAERADGFVSRLFGASLNGGSAIEIELPFGTPRFTNAATLRQLLGGKPGDRLLRNTQNGTWEICEDSLRVDLLDQHVQFRVGPVAVYS